MVQILHIGAILDCLNLAELGSMALSERKNRRSVSKNAFIHIQIHPMSNKLLEVDDMKAAFHSSRVCISRLWVYTKCCAFVAVNWLDMNSVAQASGSLIVLRASPVARII